MLMLIRRFNSYDGRLDRSMEAAVLVMEALKGFESQLQYDIWGHSGETPDLQFVAVEYPPKNEKERLQVRFIFIKFIRRVYSS